MFFFGFGLCCCAEKFCISFLPNNFFATRVGGRGGGVEVVTLRWVLQETDAGQHAMPLVRIHAEQGESIVVIYIVQ
jgi:hypothetical protein